mgnify:CR=1 FL=1
MEKYGYEKGTENGSQNFVTTERKSHVQQSQDGKITVRAEKKFDEIDSEMALVPELPKDFDDFVDREVLPQYLFYDAGRKVTKGYCTHCRKEVKIQKPHYGEVGECPSCKHPVTYRSRKKGGNVHVRGYCRAPAENKRGICIPIF